MGAEVAIEREMLKVISIPVLFEKVDPKEMNMWTVALTITEGEEKLLLVYQRKVETSIMEAAVVEEFVAVDVAEEAVDMASQEIKKSVAHENMTEEVALDEGMLELYLVGFRIPN